jgi:hypothetical protein
MLSFLKSLIARDAFPQVLEQERAYLNAAVSRIDLERREREVERGLFRRSAPHL